MVRLKILQRLSNLKVEGSQKPMIHRVSPLEGSFASAVRPTDIGGGAQIRPQRDRRHHPYGERPSLGRSTDRISMSQLTGRTAPQARLATQRLSASALMGLGTAECP